MSATAPIPERCQIATLVHVWMLTPPFNDELRGIDEAQRWAVLVGENPPYDVAGVFTSPEDANESVELYGEQPSLLVDLWADPDEAFYDVGIVRNIQPRWHIWPRRSPIGPIAYIQEG